MRTNSLHFLGLAVVLLLCFVVALPATAKGRGGGGGNKPKTPPPAVDTRKVIEAINAADNTIEIKNMRDGSVHTYKIDDITVVHLNNSQAKFSDIKVGMVVVDEVERDGDTLDDITVQEDNTPKTPPNNKKKTT